MLSVIVECDPDQVTVGMSVNVRFVPTEDEDIAIPVFEPTG
jgi:uncharacterized OB-fold protein